MARSATTSRPRGAAVHSGRAALVSLALLACNPPAAHDAAVAAPRPPAPPAPDCDDPPAAVLTYLSDKTCPSVLYQEAAELALRSLTPGARATPALAPEECRPCRYTGVVTPAGPVVLAVRVPPGSELADAAWIGAAQDGEPLAFAPLWYDRPVLGDSTLQGPAWALAPHVCGKSLVLWPVARLPGADAEEPSPALLAAAGVYASRRGELTRLGDPVPNDRSTCTPVRLELP
jgi:hypothetical protein